MQNPVPRTTHHASRITHHASGAFTMIEIAISLAIIGFALIAIIGVLPIGMNAQKDNREETVINQDSTVILEAIRNGAKGLDDLTNYVVAITNTVTVCKPSGAPKGPAIVFGYTYTDSSRNGSPMSPSFPINNGYRIVGLLSTPKYLPAPLGNSDFTSNHVVAYVRAMSGPVNEKPPQNNRAVQEFAFSYRMTSEVIPYGTNYFDPSWTVDPVYRLVLSNLQTKLHDVRLTFRWPLRSRGQVGQGGQAFRTLVGGSLQGTNGLGLPLLNPPASTPYDVYFFEPRNYVRAP